MGLSQSTQNEDHPDTAVRMLEIRRTTVFQVVRGLSDTYLDELERALIDIKCPEAEFPQIVSRVLQRAQCLDQADVILSRMTR